MIKISFKFVVKIMLAILAALAVNIAILFTCPPESVIGNVAKDFLSLAVGGGIFCLLTIKNLKFAKKQ